MKDTFTQIDILRHGECVGGNIFRGSTDVSLTERGWLQMNDAVSELTGLDRIVTSPLDRCQAFARHYAQQSNLPLTVNDEWREIHFGVWEGQKVEDVWARDTEALNRYFSEPGSMTPEGGESLLEVRERVTKAWHQTLEQYPNEHLLIVQHAGTIRLLLSYLMNSPINTANRFDISYAALTQVRVYHNDGEHLPVLLSHNSGHNSEHSSEHSSEHNSEHNSEHSPGADS